MSYSNEGEVLEDRAGELGEGHGALAFWQLVRTSRAIGTSKEII
jgi:hypothetical protein